ncbi:hypothetical protein PILCRDRAFT_127985 [Piloderma croceum F 1598]|uniref:Uncharacterized protein n=1 Tax=Piloderma croceum (strain F 1598) TaxID=765440 RepID=A0A0C3GLB3_PILCF|nr:hypothetical protein PILCRDRAFT_127985 [Piloderma croceum F 1598]
MKVYLEHLSAIFQISVAHAVAKAVAGHQTKEPNEKATNEVPGSSPDHDDALVGDTVVVHLTLSMLGTK